MTHHCTKKHSAQVRTPQARMWYKVNGCPQCSRVAVRRTDVLQDVNGQLQDVSLPLSGWVRCENSRGWNGEKGVLVVFVWSVLVQIAVQPEHAFPEGHRCLGAGTEICSRAKGMEGIPGDSES
jgi:hypothetical protein